MRPIINSESPYYQAKIAELTMQYAGRGMDLDANYFQRLNAYRDAMRYASL